MAGVYFLKDNEGTAARYPDRTVKIDKIISAFSLFKIKFLSKDNISLTSDHLSKYRSHVVLLIEADEATMTIEKEVGFYVLDGISQNEFSKKIS